MSSEKPCLSSPRAPGGDPINMKSGIKNQCLMKNPDCHPRVLSACVSKLVIPANAGGTLWVIHFEFEIIFSDFEILILRSDSHILLAGINHKNLESEFSL